MGYEVKLPGAQTLKARIVGIYGNTESGVVFLHSGNYKEYAAPAKYGLNNDFKTTANVTDLDGYLTNGWYKYLNDAGVTLVKGFVVYYALCRVDSYSTSYVVQTLYPRAYLGCSLQRYFSNGVWSEWEWVNPPLVTNVEYRTTERYKGAAVYKKVDANNDTLWRKDGESQWHLLASADYVAAATVE